MIFITTHSELVYNSFDFQPFNFIRKTDIIPVEKKVSEILQKLLIHTMQNRKVMLEDKTGKQSVYIRDIVYIESMGHYCNFFIKNKATPIKQRCTIKECLDFYSKYNFIQVHRSFIINLRHLSILNLNKNEIQLEWYQKNIPLGRKYKDIVDEKYTLYLRTTI